MGDKLGLGEVRDAVAIERREALKNPKKEDLVGASIVARRPGGTGTAGALELKLDRSLPEGADSLTVSWQKESAAAELTSARLSTDGAPVIEVSVTTLPGDRIRRVQVAPRQEALFIALDEVLAELESTTSPFVPRLTDVTSRPQRLSLTHVAPADLARNGATWNPGQHRAIEAALTHDLTYVWGPPGTGKTDLLAAVVEGAVIQGHRVLFLAPTKVAVDQALHRIADRLDGYDGFEHGLVQRWGKVELPALADAYGAFVDRDQIRTRLSQGLDARQRNLTSQRDEWAALADVAHERTRRTEELAAISRQLETTRQRLNAATSSGPARWLKKAVGVDVPAPGEIGDLASTLEELQLSVLEAGRSLDALGAEHPRERAAVKQVEQIDERLTEIARELEGQDALLKETLMVAGATLDGAIQRRTEPEAFDTVVIDEVGMIPLPKAIAAASMASARLVMVGDFRQLPAVTATESQKLKSDKDKDLYGRWYERDVFDAGGLIGADGQVVTSPKLVALDTQYRMRPGICALVNAVAYPDRPLTTGRDDTARVVSTVLREPLVLVDTAVAGFTNSTSKTTFNPVHAAVMREVLRALQADHVLPLRRTPDVGDALVRDLGVIAPYRDQVKRLVAQIDERFGEAPRGVVNTVHSFQGSERPVMVVDTVAHAGRDDLGWFYRGVDLNSTTTRLLNVALSRAQDHLVVLADVNLLRSKANPKSATRRMIDHLAAHAQVLRAGDLVPIRSASELRNLPEENAQTPAFFTADETPAAVEWDIQRARTGIEIFTPFISRSTLRQRLAALKAATARGVAVTVWTRETTVEDETAAIKELRAAGVVIEQRDQMRKAVRDGSTSTSLIARRMKPRRWELDGTDAHGGSRQNGSTAETSTGGGRGAPTYPEQALG